MNVLERIKPCKALFLASFLLSHQKSSAEKKDCATPQTVVDSTYKPGQVWTYKTRPGENSSTLTILRVESTPHLGVIIHVRIDRIQLSNCTGGPAPNVIGHAPFTKAAIDQSVIHERDVSSELPNFQAAYTDWLSHCGGVYTIPVAKMIDVDDQTFSRGLGCKS